MNNLDKNLPHNFLFFWGHSCKDSKITKACFSQWYPCNFSVDGVEYNCAEQYMMAEKARLMGDEETRNLILNSTAPKEIKAFGKLVKNFNEEIWCNNRLKVVIKGNFHKFKQNNLLKEFLINTGDKILVEASPYDTIWGIGMK